MRNGPLILDCIALTDLTMSNTWSSVNIPMTHIQEFISDQFVLSAHGVMGHQINPL